MRQRRWLIVLLALTALLSTHSQAAWEQPPPGSQTVADVLLIKFRPDSTPAEQAATVEALGGTIVDRIPQLRYVAARFPRLAGGTQPEQAAALLSALDAQPSVELAKPNGLVHAYDEPQPATPDATISRQGYLPLVGAEPFPNDPYVDSQYAWQIIDAYDGWSYGTGSAGVVVAVIDTGIQADHPDLKAKLVPGYDFVQNDAAPDDERGHGTHVAGTIAASTNNRVGVAGTCPECRLMPVRVLDASGNGTELDVAKGIVYAADHGAQVINLSLGGDLDVTAMADAVDYAWGKGVLLACAAGNGGFGDNTVQFPAYYSNCLAVGATDEFDLPAYYSTYGTWVDLAAPGDHIYSTALGSGYEALSGTSMATPHVAGVAGLLAAKGLSNAQIRARLQSSADPIGGTGEYWSNGRLNMLRALRGP